MEKREGGESYKEIYYSLFTDVLFFSLEIVELAYKNQHRRGFIDH